MLGYDLADFDENLGRYFYNAGATYRNYVNVFWNDPDKPRHKIQVERWPLFSRVKVRQN